MKHLSILLAVVLISNCNRQNFTRRTGAPNITERIDSRQVIHQGEPWNEVTIIQRINPKAPAYVVGIRDTKWANRLRWALVEQSIATDRVTSRFRFKPIGDTKALTFTCDDFEWYPNVIGFTDIGIAIKETDQITNGRRE